MAELAQWLADGYAPAYRTACMILRNPADAEEAVQEAFLRAWRFRAAIGDGVSFKPWIYRVVVNACMSKLRTEIPHRDRRAGDAALESVPGASGLPEEEAARTELADAMLGALASLPPHLRVPIVLRYYAQLSEKEIAVAIRKRPGTVKSRLHEGRRRLGEYPALQMMAAEWTGGEGIELGSDNRTGEADTEAAR